MKYITIVSIYILIILLNFYGVDFYVEKSGLPGGEIGMLSIQVLIIISSTSAASIVLYFLLSLKFKMDILKAILLNQLIYLSIFIFVGFNPFQNKTDFWLVFISFIVQFIILSTYFLRKIINKKHEKST
jgi:hypothetical protein